MVPMVNARTKGKRGENQVKTQYLDHMGIRLKRDLEQWRSADHGDLLPDFKDGDFDWPFCIEVKTYSNTGSDTHRPAWWQQVRKAAKAQGLIPVLWYKYDRRDWRIVMHMNHVSFALGGSFDHQDETLLLTMDMDTCFYVTREILSARASA